MSEVSINLIPCESVSLNLIHNYFPQIYRIVCVNENRVLILNCFTGKAFLFIISAVDEISGPVFVGVTVGPTVL